MVRDINVGQVEFCKGKPKVCVPVSGSSKEEVLWEIEQLGGKFDLIEWRADFFSDDKLSALSAIKEATEGKPVLVTFRTLAEGGRGKVSGKEYNNIIKDFILSRKADMIDIEFARENCKELIDLAKEHKVVTVVSSHCFSSMLKEAELTEILKAMADIGADIPKVAGMPQSFSQVIELMAATLKISEDNFPIITIAMGKLGKVSRLCGEFTGSAITFGSGKLPSSPGQIKSDFMYEILNELHK